jgi:hypothetical protein
MRFMHQVLGALAACCLAIPLTASTTYTYTGNDFQSVFGGSYTTSDFVSGFFTVATVLPDNLTNSNNNVTPTAYSFTDGVQTFSSLSPPTNITFDIGTDASGNIISWDITLGSGPPNNNSVTTDWNASDIGQMIGFSQFGEVLGDPGTWTASTSTTATPEPGTFGVIGILLVAAEGLRRRASLPRSVK